jgi:hypothetical protein
VLRAGGMGDKIEEFDKEVVSGDYNNLLRVCIDWFDTY